MQNQEADLKDLINNLHVGVYRRTVGQNSRFLFVNSVLRKLLGYEDDEMQNVRVVNLFPDQRMFKTLTEKLYCHGFLKNEKIQLIKKDKKAVWCNVSSVLVNDDKGHPQWIDGIVEDITVQKQIEKDLKESKELFRLVFENSPVAITVADKNEKILAWNPFSETMLDMTKEDLFNKPISELYPPAEWRRIRSYEIRKKGIISDLETKVIKKDGSLLDVNMSISVLRDANDQITGSIGIMRDITRYKIAERQIKESENKVRIILDNSPVAMTLTDEEGRIVMWNKFTEQLFGMKKSDLFMKPASSLHSKEEWKKIQKVCLANDNVKQQMETKILGKDGREVDVVLSINTLTDIKDKTIGSVSVMQDITEQKKDQQLLLEAKKAAEEASNSKSMFLANVSHEVRTPMNTIIGTLDLALDAPLSQEQKENLITAKDAADNLLSLLNDILDLSRVESGKLNLEMIELNIHKIINSACKGLSLLAKKKDLELSWNVDPDIPPLLVGDPTRIRQILVNLINNAIKFTFKGKVQVNVKPVSSSKEECELLFSVSDEGIGIPADKQEHIFDAFTQADDSTTRRFGGTGLGLAISKRLVEMMGGRIWVESENLKGSTFYFTGQFNIIPGDSFLPSDSTDMRDQEGSTDRSKREIGTVSILVAEDNIVNQKIVVKLLEKRGWSIKAVDNGQKVLDLLDKEKFDMVLMDAQMPVLDGFETTRLIREKEEKTGKRIPIVALTARAMADDKKKCLDAGMDDYVSKPIDRLKLYEAVENAFYKKENT